jgi:chloride channel, nucleotide-sensitive, 1A
MALVAIQDAPNDSDFITIEEHQSRTPVTFFDGQPVLHLRCRDVKLVADKADVEKYDVLNRFFQVCNPALVGERSRPWGPVAVEGLDVWVTSEYTCPKTPSEMFD